MSDTLTSNTEELAKLIAEVEELNQRCMEAFQSYLEIEEQLTLKLELLEKVNKHNKELNEISEGEIVNE